MSMLLLFNQPGVSATGTGTPAAVSLTPATGSASAGMVINGDANGAPAPIQLTAASGSASGSASASGTPAPLSFTSATGSASGGASASGSPAGITLTAATGGASGGSAESSPEISYAPAKRKSKAGKAIGGARWQRYEIEDLKTEIITKPEPVEQVEGTGVKQSYGDYVELIKGIRQATAVEQELRDQLQQQIQSQADDEDEQIAAVIAAML